MLALIVSCHFISELTTFYQPNRSPKNATEESATVVGEKRSFEAVNECDKWTVGLIPSGYLFEFLLAQSYFVIFIFIHHSDSVSRLIPREFEEIYVRIFCRDVNQKKLVDEAFDEVYV